MENSMEIPQKIKNRTAIWSSNSTPGYLSKEDKNANSKRYMHPYVHHCIIYNSQDMEATQVPINRWMDKEDVVYIYLYVYNGIYPSHKKNELLPFVTTQMDLKDIRLSEISQRKTNSVWFYLQWNLKNKWTNITKQKQS